VNGTQDQPRILVVDDRPANVELLEASHRTGADDFLSKPLEQR
jgi:hypothetical protein